MELTHEEVLVLKKLVEKSTGTKNVAIKELNMERNLPYTRLSKFETITDKIRFHHETLFDIDDELHDLKKLVAQLYEQLSDLIDTD